MTPQFDEPHRFGSLRERVRGCDGEDEAHAADRQAATAGSERRGIGCAIRGADREVGATRHERIPGAAEHFVGDAQPRRRRGVEALERGQQRRERDDGVERDAQFAFPAAGQQPYALREVVDRGEQRTAFAQQRLAR